MSCRACKTESSDMDYRRQYKMEKPPSGLPSQTVTQPAPPSVSDYRRQYEQQRPALQSQAVAPTAPPSVNLAGAKARAEQLAQARAAFDRAKVAGLNGNGSTGDLNIAPQVAPPQITVVQQAPPVSQGNTQPTAELPAEPKPCACQDNHEATADSGLGLLAALLLACVVGGAVAGYTAGAIAQ